MLVSAVAAEVWLLLHISYASIIVAWLASLDCVAVYNVACRVVTAIFSLSLCLCQGAYWFLAVLSVLDSPFALEVDSLRLQLCRRINMQLVLVVSGCVIYYFHGS